MIFHAGKTDLFWNLGEFHTAIWVGLNFLTIFCKACPTSATTVAVKLRGAWRSIRHEISQLWSSPPPTPPPFRNVQGSYFSALGHFLKSNTSSKGVTHSEIIFEKAAQKKSRRLFIILDTYRPAHGGVSQGKSYIFFVTTRWQSVYSVDDSYSDDSF